MLAIQLVFNVGCYESGIIDNIGRTNDTEKPVRNRLEEFQSDRLKFKLSIDEDVNKIVAMYQQNKQNLTFYFGFLPSNDTLEKEARSSIADNRDYLVSGKQEELTWSIFSQVDTESTIKKGDFLGTIKAQRIQDASDTFGLPEEFAKVLKQKFVFNMARFLITKAQGQRFGTEACRAYVKHIFSNTKADLIISVSDAKNLPSRKSALSCGFEEIGKFESDSKSSYFLIKKRPVI
jgi:RimJ/RimL family protein N-acetyltransferase